MTRRHPDDLSGQDIITFLCPHCRIPVNQLLEFDFPHASYQVGELRFWTPDDLRPWIEARARANLLGMGDEVDKLAALCRLVGARPMTGSEAREFALSRYAAQVVEAVLQRRPYTGQSPAAHIPQ